MISTVDRFGIEIPAESENTADAYRIFLPDSISKVLFKVRDYYFDGKLKLIGTTRFNSPDVKMEGRCTGFYPNGKRKFDVTFTNNLADGDFIRYYQDGSIYMKGTYDDKGKLYLIECHDEKGNITAENGKGRWLKFDENTEKRIAEGNVNDGLEDGEWVGLIGDSLKYKCTYDKGHVVSGKSYGTSGREYLFDKEIVSADFIGGSDAMNKYILGHIRVPDQVKSGNIHGKVYVTFVVEKDGSVTGVKDLAGIGGGAREECVKVVSGL